MTDTLHPKKALISVSNKNGLIPFAQKLVALGVEILSTGGTARTLEEAGLSVTAVQDVTGFPEIMGGRVKTLHPKIHGGILGRRGVDDAVMQQHQIDAIDLVVINLYPFTETIQKADCTYADAVENIDIGGPAMVRAAAKNHNDVAVIVNPQRYDEVLNELEGGGIAYATRQALASEAFGHTSAYDLAVHAYFERSRTGEDAGDIDERNLPETIALETERKTQLRYGENPHQRAALYTDRNIIEGSLTHARQLQGKELSWNNLNDAHAALSCVREFDEAACVIVKHANPCGVAVDESIAKAYQRAYACDPVSAFGGIIAVNRPLDKDTAEQMVSQQFIEVVLAPSVNDGALAVFAQKKNIRVLAVSVNKENIPALDIRRIDGGWLVQDEDRGSVRANELKLVTKTSASDAQIADLMMAWTVCKFVKSNAIVYAKDGATLGIGAGQMSRVHSAQIAGIKAAESGLPIEGAVMASDAFFPFRDAIDAAAQRGISAIIQPGASMRDDEVIAAANEHGIAMLFTGMRHFRH